MIVYDYWNWLFVFSGYVQTLPTAKPPLMMLTNVLVASQKFADESLQHTILATENSPQPTILQYTQVWAFENDMAWCPKKIENAKWLSKKHNRQSAWQTSP